MYPPVKEVRPRALECPPDRPQRTVWIEVARQVEADLSGECPAHAQPAAIHEPCRVEPCRIPAEAEWNVQVARVRGPPIGSQTNYADAHGFMASTSPCTTARAWRFRSGPRNQLRNQIRSYASGGS